MGWRQTGTFADARRFNVAYNCIGIKILINYSDVRKSLRVGQKVRISMATRAIGQEDGGWMNDRKK